MTVLRSETGTLVHTVLMPASGVVQRVGGMQYCCAVRVILKAVRLVIYVGGCWKLHIVVIDYYT